MSTLTPLVSSAAYGVSDYLGGVASRRTSALGVVAIAYPTSVIGMALLALVVPGESSAAGLAWGAASGVVMAFAIWWFYLALAAGPISVVSPTTAVLVAAIPVVIGVAQGESPQGWTWAGIALGLVAVVLVSCDLSGADRRITGSTLLLAIGAGTAFALSFVLTAEIPTGSGMLPLVAARGAATLVVFAFLLTRHHTPEATVSWPQRLRSWSIPVLIGVVDVVANAAMYFTFQFGELAIGSLVIALYPAFTVALAVLVLRERIHPIQSGGLLASVAAILLINASA
ncbi:EamA family transporter [Nocardioides bruguierae]|uniref:DMT family transporter n=1 Tax=Nocardioides bruguierae TaxID=2945102 RepID=A0A9X2D9Z3_9ACTN|nr:DMT family transporter [Nocardioides bruguierae]MCM0621784.1 DMT family transporter [Nocardioides bruguierae]